MSLLPSSTDDRTHPGHCKYIAIETGKRVIARAALEKLIAADTGVDDGDIGPASFPEAPSQHRGPVPCGIDPGSSAVSERIAERDNGASAPGCGDIKPA